MNVTSRTDLTTEGEGLQGRIRRRVRQLYPTLTEAGLHIYTAEWMAQFKRLKEIKALINNINELIETDLFTPMIIAELQRDCAELRCEQDKVEVRLAEYEHKPGALMRVVQGGEGEAKILHC